MAPPTTGFTDGLAVVRYASDDDVAPPVVIVHGAMDRAMGFRRAARHLEGLDVTAYDRRGYAGSLDAGVSPTMAAQVDDVEKVMGSLGGGPVVVVGHSLGGLIALHAAARHPERIAAVGAWEPPMPWFDWYVSNAADNVRGLGEAATDADAAEAFMRAMIGDRLWERLPAAVRAERRAEGATLRADLKLTRSPDSVLDFTTLTVPTVAGCGSESASRFRGSAARLLADVPDAFGVEVAGAGHGAHLSHPTEFAAFVRATHARAPRSA